MPDIFISSQPQNTAKKGNKSKKVSFASQAISSFLFLPDGVRFETQIPGETIILLLRKHWITNIAWVFMSFVFLVAPIFLFPAISLGGLIPPGFPASLLTFSILGWYLITFSYIFVNFILWYFTVSIVTNERIIDIDYINILNKKFAETRIDRLEDVTGRTGGFLKSFIDYGDVFVQTAATEAVFHFLEIPHPGKVVQIINELMAKVKEGGA
jgi:uncharacterized membrane protein